MNGLALFAGGGGLELGLSLALGTDYRTIAYVERECTSAAVLAANMERGWLDKAPVWDDVTTFTGDVVSPLVDNIDIISAGFPCQPWSVAGRRAGTADDRWLWPYIVEILGAVHPQWAFFENVPGLLRGGLGPILGDLAALGFDAEWTSVRAADVGAPHRRERIFLLGNADSQRRRTQGNGELSPTRTGWGGRPVLWPPGPGSTEDWREVIEVRPDLAPATQPEVRGMDDGLAPGLARTDRLRILGNGVVPQQAALAFQILKERITNGSASTSK